MALAPVDFFEAQRRARRRTAWTLLTGSLALLLVGVAYGGTAVLIIEIASLGRPVDLAPLLAVATGVPLLWAAVSGWRAFRAFSDGRRGAFRLGARPVQTDRPEERVLRNVVEEVAVAAALPAPALFVWDGQPGLNALALGHDARDGALVFTDQAVQTLSRDALQATAAHEMAHLAAGDTRLNGVLVAFVAGLEAPLRAVWRGTKSVLEDEAPYRDAAPSLLREMTGVATADNPSLTAALLVVIVAGTFTLVGAPWVFAALAVGVPAYVLLGLLGLFLARLLAVSVARQREHHADALALQLTRHPEALAEAVQTIAEAPLQGLVLSRHRHAIRHFFFGRPDIPSPVWGDTLSAHPSADTRIDHIRQAPRTEYAPPAPTLRPAPPPQSAPAPRPAATPDASAPPPTPSPRPAVRAAETLATLPEALLTAAHAPADAAALLLALATSAPASLPFWEDVQSLDRTQRLALVEIALPALRALEVPARVRLIRAVTAAVYADDHVSAWEHTVLATLRYGLGDTPRRRRLPEAAFGDALWTLLHRTAQEEGVHSEPAIARGRELLRRAGLSVPAPSYAAPDAAAFDRALDRLATALPEQQRLALELTDAAVHADGCVTEEEGDLTCALALALGQPLPGWATGAARAPAASHAVEAAG